MAIFISILKGIAEIFFKYWKQILSIILIITGLFFIWSYRKDLEKQKLEIQKLKKAVTEYEEIVKQNEAEIKIVSDAYADLATIKKTEEKERDKNRKTIIKYRTIRETIEKDCGKCPDIYDPVWDRINELFGFDPGKETDKY